MSKDKLVPTIIAVGTIVLPSNLLLSLPFLEFGRYSPLLNKIIKRIQVNTKRIKPTANNMPHIIINELSSNKKYLFIPNNNKGVMKKNRPKITCDTKIIIKYCIFCPLL